MQYLFGILTFLTSLFLILLVLIQRGRGGGLAGALGGMGGQSAFGTKAGDLFTRITIGVAAFWIILSVAAIKLLNTSQDSVFGSGRGSSALSNEKTDKDEKKTLDPKGGASLTVPPADDTIKSSPGPAAAPDAPASPAVSAPASPPSADSPAEKK